MIAGATGVLLRETSPQAIMPAIESVHLGGQVLCNEAARSLLDDAPLTRLTQRESDVLQLVAQGAGNAEIARRLQLGEKTVRNYVSRLYHKLDLNKRVEIASYALHADISPEVARIQLESIRDESLVDSP